MTINMMAIIWASCVFFVQNNGLKLLKNQRKLTEIIFPSIIHVCFNVCDGFVYKYLR